MQYGGTNVLHGTHHRPRIRIEQGDVIRRLHRGPLLGSGARIRDELQHFIPHFVTAPSLRYNESALAEVPSRDERAFHGWLAPKERREAFGRFAGYAILEPTAP
jgi:hypothetical protein